MRLNSLAVLCALGMALPVAGGAQDAVTATSARGWIGIRVDVSTRVMPGTVRNAFAILVTDVYRGGPADRSGIVPGDRLVGVNGTRLADYDAWLRSLTDLGPGQSLRVIVVRGAGEQEVTLVAGQRPPSLQPALAMDRFITERARLGRSIDSLIETVWRMTLGDSPVLRWSDTPERLRAAEQMMRASQEEILESVREARERTRAAEDRTLVTEEPFVPPAAGGGGPELQRAEAAEDRRILLTSYLVGDPVVLGGAFVRSLTGELGRYFAVESGVLVTAVVNRSPAANAGLRPGDVIVSVGSEQAATVTGLRDVLAEAVFPVELTIIRQGNYLKLSYPSR